MKPTGIVTIDYEDHGRGVHLIDPIKNVIDPTYRIADFFESFGIPLTLYVNVTEVLAYERYNLTDAELYRTQLRDLQNRGHDLQLHFHPQWLDYKWSNGGWDNQSPIPYVTQSMDYKHWRDSLVVCRDWLTELTGVPPTSYRAGGYCIEPINTNMQVLKDIGIHSDSSLHAGDAKPYKIGDILELPIYGTPRGRWDMSGREEDANYLVAPQDDCVYVMIGHNKQRVHYDALERCIRRLDHMKWQTMSAVVDGY